MLSSEARPETMSDVGESASGVSEGVAVSSGSRSSGDVDRVLAEY